MNTKSVGSNRRRGRCPRDVVLPGRSGPDGRSRGARCAALDLTGRTKTVTLGSGAVHEAHAVVFATGSAPRKIGVQFGQPVEFDLRGIGAEGFQHILAQQENGARRHRQDGQQDRGEQAQADRYLQGRLGMDESHPF